MTMADTRTSKTMAHHLPRETIITRGQETITVELTTSMQENVTVQDSIIWTVEDADLADKLMEMQMQMVIVVITLTVVIREEIITVVPMQMVEDSNSSMTSSNSEAPIKTITIPVIISMITSATLQLICTNKTMVVLPLVQESHRFQIARQMILWATKVISCREPYRRWTVAPSMIAKE